MHAPQGYIVVRLFFQTVANWPGRPMDRLRLQALDLKRGFLRKTASSQRYRIQVAAVLAHSSVILLALAAPSVFVTGFAIVFVTTQYITCAYLLHWTLTLNMCNCSPEGRYDPI